MSKERVAAAAATGVVSILFWGGAMYEAVQLAQAAADREAALLVGENQTDEQITMLLHGGTAITLVLGGLGAGAVGNALMAQELGEHS